MTDEVRFPSAVTVRVNGVAAGRHELADDPADHRGILSWHSQLKDKKLREAGSYGYLVEVPIPRAAWRRRRPRARCRSAWRWTRRCREVCDLRRALRALPARPHGRLRAQAVDARVALILCRRRLAAALGRARPSGGARIVIDAAQVEGQIDTRLYGQFLEFMYEGVKGGLSAELAAQPRLRGGAQRDRALPRLGALPGRPHRRLRLELPVGRHRRLSRLARLPRREAVAALPAGGRRRRDRRAARDLPAAPPGARGRSRTRVSLAEDDRLRGAGRGRARGRPVAGGRTYAEAEVRDIRGDWTQYPFVLRPDRADTHARLAILFAGKGRLWVDQVSLLPGMPWAESGPTSRRAWPRCGPRSSAGPAATSPRTITGGGASAPATGVPSGTNLSWKNEREPGDIGTDEFVAFCRRVGAEPSITVNVEGRGATVEEAAAWVEYCNGPATSTYGAMRAANGHPEPLSREVLGDRQRDLGRLGARPLRRRHLRAQCPPLRPGHARGGPRHRAHRHRRQRHELEPRRAPGRRLRDRPPGHPPLLRAQGDGRGRAQPDGAAALLRALLPGGRASSSTRRLEAGPSGSPSTSGGSTCPRPASTRWRPRSTGRG